MPTRRKRATIREVAEPTGLSPAAVSYALRGIQTSEETQQRVRRAAAELGYEAHPIARALASGRTGMVGLLCGSLEDFWQQSLAVGIGRALLARDRYAIILDAAGDPERELTLAQRLRDQRVDGLIVQPVDPAAPLWAELADALPVVSIGDGLRGGHAHGEVERLGLEVSVVTSHQALPAATTTAAEVLSKRPRPTAVFCFTDSIAYGVYAATRELGLAVPGDVSVAGYDNHPMSALLTPPLTSVDWDIEGIVHAAVRVVVGAIEGKPRKRRIMCEPNLRRRDSTGPPAPA